VFFYDKVRWFENGYKNMKTAKIKNKIIAHLKKPTKNKILVDVCFTETTKSGEGLIGGHKYTFFISAK